MKHIFYVVQHVWFNILCGSTFCVLQHFVCFNILCGSTFCVVQHFVCFNMVKGQVVYIVTIWFPDGSTQHFNNGLKKNSQFYDEDSLLWQS